MRGRQLIPNAMRTRTCKQFNCKFTDKVPENIKSYFNENCDDNNNDFTIFMQMTTIFCGNWLLTLTTTTTIDYDVQPPLSVSYVR